MMHDTVRIVRKSVDDTFLRFVHLEDAVFRRSVCLVLQGFVQAKDVGLTVAVMDAHTVGLQLTFAGFLVCQPKVLYRDYPFVKIAYTFHLCFAYIIGAFGVALLTPF